MKTYYYKFIKAEEEDELSIIEISTTCEPDELEPIYDDELDEFMDVNDFCECDTATWEFEGDDFDAEYFEERALDVGITFIAVDEWN